MRTVRCNSHLLGGGVCQGGGVCPGVSARPPCEQNDSNGNYLFRMVFYLVNDVRWRNVTCKYRSEAA